MDYYGVISSGVLSEDLASNETRASLAASSGFIDLFPEYTTDLFISVHDCYDVEEVL